MTTTHCDACGIILAQQNCGERSYLMVCNDTAPDRLYDLCDKCAEDIETNMLRNRGK